MPTLTKNDLATLIYLANQAYLGFKRAAKSQHPLDYRGASGLYDSLGECLREALGAGSYMDWKRDRPAEPVLKEFPELDGVIVQCLIGKMGTSQLFTQRKTKSPSRPLNEEDSRKVMQLLRSRASDYHMIAWNATILANAGREDLILEALNAAGLEAS